MATIVLITGASSGVGKACAEYLASKGYVVYGTSRKESESDISNLHFLRMDVTNRESVNEGISRIIKEQGRLDVVVNNAGIGIMGAIELATEAEVRLQMDTNFMGVANVCSAAIPFLREQRSGKIINISSVGGLMGLPYQGFYSASKFAVEGYSEALKLELHAFNVKVALIEPGDFNTGFTGNRLLSQATRENDDYKMSLERTLRIIEHEELNGGNPIQIAKQMEKIIRKNNPPFRNPVGKFEQVLSIYVKRILPSGWYSKIVRIYYKVDQ